MALHKPSWKCEGEGVPSCKRDAKSSGHPGMELVPVRAFPCKHPLILLLPVFSFQELMNVLITTGIANSSAMTQKHLISAPVAKALKLTRRTTEFAEVQNYMLAKQMFIKHLFPVLIDVSLWQINRVTVSIRVPDKF